MEGKDDHTDTVVCEKRNEKPHATELGQTQSGRKTKFNDPTMDPEWLYHTLRKEINKEAAYKLENDAKIRAVSQGTVDYEQFRQMVLGAHIRPLQKADKVEGCQFGKRPHVVWNTAAKPTEK